MIGSIVGLWLCYFVLATLRGWVIGFSLDWAMLSRRMVVAAGSMAVTALLWPLLHAFAARPLGARIALVMGAALPAALLLAQINAMVFADIEKDVVAQIGEKGGISIRRDEAGNVLVDLADPPRAGAAGPGSTPLLIDAETDDETRWRQLTDLALGRYFLLLAWAALYLALAAAEEARAAERREGEYRRAAKAAELRSLRYQINPHFLFNTLNSLSALVMTGRAAAAEQMIQTLSNFYRTSLAEDPTSDHSLGEEIRLQQLYLEIEGVRFPERLRTRVAVPDDLLLASVPGMILQPLVENAVKYAVAPLSRAVTVTISARRERGRLVLAVSDDGPGDGKGGTKGLGIGLANVRDRLHARFGDDAGLIAGPAPGGGFHVELIMPLAGDAA